MANLLVFIGVLFALNSPLLAHELEQSCIDDAFDASVNYCYKLYRRRSSAFASCKLGAAHTYEARLMNEPAEFKEICHPYYLDSCDSGRKLLLAKETEFCQ